MPLFENAKRGAVFPKRCPLKSSTPVRLAGRSRICDRLCFVAAVGAAGAQVPEQETRSFPLADDDRPETAADVGIDCPQCLGGFLVRRARFQGNPRSVSAPERPSHRLPLHAQARIMAQSDRNLVFHSGAKAHPPRQLLQQANVEAPDGSSPISPPPWPGTPAGPTKESLSPDSAASEPKMSPSIPLGCTSTAERKLRLRLA